MMEKTINGQPVRECEIFGQVMTTSGYLNVVANGVVFQNTGDDTVTINKTITILPRASFNFSMNNVNEIIVQKFMVQFAGVGVAPRLEVIEVLVKDPVLAHYVTSKKF